MCKKWLVAVVFCLILPFANAQNDTEYEEIEWIVLMPDDDLAALMNPPSYIDDVMEGSPADSLDLLHGGIEEDPRTAPYLKALGSTTVIEEYNGRNIRIPGFIVPLSSDDDQNITEFFIVPYFGACLHLPPPPPNQMLHVKTDKGVQLKSLEDAFWFEGTLKVETTNSMLGTAAYGLELANWMPYE